ncbi:MAG TPA: rRNA adenine N-6-methyltransferase family protein [Stellaceae bacterium]|jgi:protein-L-isoaspartate(D-aspartate) O-methyltransferase
MAPSGIDRESELAIVRRAYAKHVLANADVDDPRVEAAFAAVRREQFLGPGPWPMLRWPRRYVPTPSDDPVYLYQDALFGIIPERGLNNGQPWLHALLIAAAAPLPGEHVVHIGAGVGYYTAILLHMAGAGGRATAIEFDPGLAERLKANFVGQPNMHVLQGDGAKVAFDPADVIYVNAGATWPVDIWLDRLNDGGRLILPLTSDKGFGENPENVPIQRRGAVFRIERRGDEFVAKWISAVAIFPCEGARDALSERALASAFEKGGWERVTRLYRRGDLPDEKCWLSATDWALAYA